MKILLQCDFDATLTIGDVSFAILDEFADGDWQGVIDRFHEGAMTVEECMSRTFSMVRTTPEALDDFLTNSGRVIIRPGLAALTDFTTRRGYDIAVVSNGLDFYISRVLAGIGMGSIEVHSAASEFTPEGINLRFVLPDGTPTTAGFKAAWSDHLRQRGYDRVYYLGDGMADIEPSRQADHVFATGRLLDACRREGRDCTPFDDLGDVVDWLKKNGDAAS